jgi:hypothetical protein
VGTVCITFDKSGHDTSSRWATSRRRSLLRGVTGKDGSLNSSTIGNNLIRVDVLVKFLVVKEVGNKFDDTRDTSGTTDQDDFKDVRLVDLQVAKDLLNRFKGTAEEILAALRNGHV